jgi:diguanylate cyclase (GGDEF)-like protein
MYHRLANLLRKNVDLLSRRWSEILCDFYPEHAPEDIFRKVRASHLLLARSLVEKDFSYLFRHLQTEFQEWILTKNSYRDLMNLEPVYIMLIHEFIDEALIDAEGKNKLKHMVDEIRVSKFREDMNEIYVGEQEKLFSRQIDELEVLNKVSGTDLVGKGKSGLDSTIAPQSTGDPYELLKLTLGKAMKVLGATDGVLAYKLNSGHDVVIHFVDAPEQRDREIVKRITLEDEDDQFDPTVLTAFSHVVDRAILRNYWNPDLVEDLRAQNCPRCPYRDELVTSIRGTVDCPILQTLKVNTFICYQLGNNGELGFFLIARNSPPAFSNEDMQFIETLSASMITIIKNYQLYETQVQLATTDGMTQLFNHRYFQEALGREISRSRRYGAPVSLLYMDIDHFKIFNDKYGHQVGDEVLKLVARTIVRNLRDSDVACRYGGEELVAILPDTDLMGGKIAAEKIRQAIEKLKLAVVGKTVGFTLSVGVATYPLNAEDKAGLIEAADGAVYEAKEAGRNLVRVSNVDPYEKDIEEEKAAVEKAEVEDQESEEAEVEEQEAKKAKDVVFE